MSTRLVDSEALPEIEASPKPNGQAGHTFSYMGLELTDDVTRVELSESMTPITVVQVKVTLEVNEDVNVTLEVSEASPAVITTKEPEMLKVDRKSEGNVTIFTVTEVKTFKKGVKLVIFLERRRWIKWWYPKCLLTLKHASKQVRHNYYKFPAASCGSP